MFVQNRRRDLQWADKNAVQSTGNQKTRATKGQDVYPKKTCVHKILDNLILTTIVSGWGANGDEEKNFEDELGVPRI